MQELDARIREQMQNADLGDSKEFDLDLDDEDDDDEFDIRTVKAELDEE